MPEPSVPTAAESGLRVAVTRSIDDNRSLTAELERHGCLVVALPLIEVADPTDGGRAIGAAMAAIDHYRWVVLTSVNGVSAVGRRLAGRDWPAGVDVAAVGPTTAAAARAAGLPVSLVPDEATAAALVAAFPTPDPSSDGGHGPADRVLAPLAELAGSTVEEGLTAKGWRVDRVEAYRTLAPADRPGRPGGGIDQGTIDPGTVDVVTFFSPSVVDRWVELAGPGATTAVAVCIGPSTADRARRRGFVSVREARPHTEDGVVAAVVGLEAGDLGAGPGSTLAP